MDNFTSLSRELNAALDKATKKEHGIFFTPKSYRDIVVTFLKERCAPRNILEPSFGSGEFVGDCATAFPEANITGVELNTTLFTKVQDHFKENPRISLHNQDFLKFVPQEKFDLIVGNPPYVVVSTGVPEEFKPVSTGRPNLYCWFIYKSIKLLAEDGILAFVIPNSMLNTSSYGLLRKFIVDECEILLIVECTNRDFQETDQATIAMILQKRTRRPTTKKYVVEHKGHVLFSIHHDFINDQLKSYPKLCDLGVSVKTGSVVWNEKKDKLKNDAGEGKLLIYSSNVKKGKFTPFEGTPRNGKKQYIDIDKPALKAPVILMNRGYGNSTYILDVMLVKDAADLDGHEEFYVENHLNVIYPTDDDGRKQIVKIYDYLKSKMCKEYVARFVGNGAMSKTEIETMLPIRLEPCN